MDAMDECKAVGREFVVARCHTPTVFDLIEETLDQITSHDQPAALIPTSSEIVVCLRAGCRAPHRPSMRAGLGSHWYRLAHESYWSTRPVTGPWTVFGSE